MSIRGSVAIADEAIEGILGRTPYKGEIVPLPYGTLTTLTMSAVEIAKAPYRELDDVYFRMVEAWGVDPSERNMEAQIDRLGKIAGVL